MAAEREGGAAEREDRAAERAARLESEAAVLARLDEAMASWCAWAKAGGGGEAGGVGASGEAPRTCAVLRQRMADLLIEQTVAAAVLAEARDEKMRAAAEARDEDAMGVCLQLLQHQVQRCLTMAAQALGETRGEAEVRWMRDELARRRSGVAGALGERMPPRKEPATAGRPDAVARRPDAAPAASAFDPELWQRFCHEVVRPAAREADRREEVSREIWSALGELGYLRLFHDAGVDDGGAARLYPAMLALAEACAATFWKATISSALCGKMLAAFAQPAMQTRWVPGLASGRWIGAFAASERGSGSDPASYAAKLQRRADGWWLSGEKQRISNASDADVAAVLCPAFDEAGAPLGLALAVVELAAPGVSRGRYPTMGLRAMSLGRLGFEAVRLDDAAVTLGTSMARILTVVEWGQVVQAMSGLGAGRAALAEAERFLGERPSFGRPLAGHPAIRHRLDGAHLQLAATAALARRAVARKAKGELAGEQIVAAKISCSEAGLAACQGALRVCGGWGYTGELAVERLVRDAHGNLPAGLPNDRLRELLIAPRLGVDPWAAATPAS